MMFENHISRLSESDQTRERNIMLKIMDTTPSLFRFDELEKDLHEKFLDIMPPSPRHNFGYGNKSSIFIIPLDG